MKLNNNDIKLIEDCIEISDNFYTEEWCDSDEELDEHLSKTKALKNKLEQIKND